ncbi:MULTISPECIES: HNH endonuclease [unclassified Haloferax]|uniref:HNH endonuclease n=1 Tax=unclassified Haloferax TaxID=2625095 RepID=UPI002875B898|nr:MULTISPECIES: HNH endonuclease [unclassified Haloferax]MDS0243543.1 HNH endonuclease [Haloferax sp. S2CR25]MDS0446664.1 HNH endonuclease [Haloferax sp. S2CR25-2]
MQVPPPELHRGDHFSQEEIEGVFDTGFGYQITGINPRTDDSGQKYVLLFAKEDGPYDDSVQSGEFTYIGEGLRGDQSEKSPGNSNLLRAVSERMPIFFFYKGVDDGKWRYQGQVEVNDSDYVERDGRMVYEFSIVYVDKRTIDSEPGLYLIPISDDWKTQFDRTVSTPVDITQYDDLPLALAEAGNLRVWGTTTTESAKKQNALDQLQSGDYLLFYHAGEFVAGGRVGRIITGTNAGEALWGEPESQYVFTVTRYTEDVQPISKVWSALGYEGREVVQGFTRVADERVSSLRTGRQSLGDVIFVDSTEDLPWPEEIEHERKAIADQVNRAPQLLEDAEYTENRRIARGQAFADAVKDAYDEQCAVCGANRLSPAGNPEVEAAHIYPRSEGGKDDIRNGVAFCKLHHWGFDTGWFTITDDHDVVVLDKPDLDGYEEFIELDGESLNLPDDEDIHPAQIYLQASREYHGFSVDE